jgi:hypothetical protein
MTASTQTLSGYKLSDIRLGYQPWRDFLSEAGLKCWFNLDGRLVTERVELRVKNGTISFSYNQDKDTYLAVFCPVVDLPDWKHRLSYGAQSVKATNLDALIAAVKAMKVVVTISEYLDSRQAWAYNQCQLESGYTRKLKEKKIIVSPQPYDGVLFLAHGDPRRIKEVITVS